MEFRILGPLEVIGDDGASVAVGGSRERGVLALLLLSANRVVPSERLAACEVCGARAADGDQMADEEGLMTERERRFIAYIATSADGFIARKDGSVDIAKALIEAPRRQAETTP